MSRRVELPGAAELFRPTKTASGSSPEPAAPVPQPGQGSGRVRHEEKITVYVSREELLALEQARFTLRAVHGLAVDRGRIVRTAIAMSMADFQEHGADSELVKRLQQ